jgi:hypothetical protein
MTNTKKGLMESESKEFAERVRINSKNSLPNSERSSTTSWSAQARLARL